MTRRSMASMQAELANAEGFRASELRLMIERRRASDRERTKRYRERHPGYQANPARSARSEENQRKRKVQDLKDQIFVYSGYVHDGVNPNYYSDLVEKAKTRLAELENADD